MNCGHDDVPENITIHPLAFISKCLSSAEQWYSNVEWETLGILYGFEKFHHWCFVKGV